ncbi:MAG: NYN domain-containing protein [Methanomassiliicoccales archaeon]
MDGRKAAAVFIDLENFYFSLTNTYGLSYDEASSACIAITDSTLELLEKRHDVIIRQAFADWSNLSEVKKELQKMGVRIIDVLSTEYKNSADIELSLAVQEVILTRPDIETVAILAGDRDYMPVALRARERGKTLYFIGFRETLSGDLKKLVGEGNYFYADPSTYKITGEAETGIGQHVTKEVMETSDFTEEEGKALQAAIDAFDQYKEKFGSVKLGAFLVDRLAKALPELSHLERKKVFQSLVERNILLTEMREIAVPEGAGDVNKFTVFRVNEEHPAVKNMRKRMQDREG